MGRRIYECLEILFLKIVYTQRSKHNSPQNRKTNFCWTYWLSIKYIDLECCTAGSNVFIRTNTTDLNHIWQHIDQLICMLAIVIPSRSHKLLDLCPSTHLPWRTYLECTCYATSCTYVYFVQCPFCIESRMWLGLKIFKKGSHRDCDAKIMAIREAYI